MSNTTMFIILCIIIAIVSGLVTLVLVPYMAKKLEEVVGDEIYDKIKKAVKAAQQTLRDNKHKKEYVFNFIKKYAEDKRIDITDDQINMLIESAVWSLKYEESIKKAISAIQAAIESKDTEE